MSGVNLLPWRKIKRARLKKRRLLYVVISLMISGIVGLIIFHFINQAKLQAKVEKTQKKTVERDEQKIVYDHLKTIIAKLPQQSLDSLQYVGMLTNGNKTWGLIRQSNNEISSVKCGDYVAREHGLVVSIYSDKINIEKTTWSKQGLKKEWMSLPCNHKKNKGH